MKFRKSISVLLVLALLCGFGCLFASAGDANVVIGKAYISFVDNGVRPARAETDPPYKYPDPIGTIYTRSAVELHAGDTVADVTKRFVEGVKGAKMGYKTTEYGTYFASIDDVTTDSGEKLDSIGEFDAGAKSGWMVRVNNQFLSVSADQAAVDLDDDVAWVYSCQWGADVGNDWNITSAEITGVTFSAGTLSPVFSADVHDYTLSLPANVMSVKADAALKNYSCKVTYTLVHDGKSVDYKYYRDIPVSDGDKIIIKSEYMDWEGKVTDTDTVTVTIAQESGSPVSFIRAFFMAIIDFFKNLFSRFTK